jgi:hypothetical protein
VASASEVNGNFQRLAAEDEAIRAELEAAIEEGNARLDTAIEEGNTVLQEAIADGNAELATIRTQISGLLQELDGVKARLAEVESAAGASSGSGNVATADPFSPTGNWAYTLHESAAGFNADRSQIFNAVFGESGVISFGEDGNLSSPPDILSPYGGVTTEVGKGTDGLVSLNGFYEDGNDEPLGEQVFPVEGTWALVEKANGAAVVLTIFDDEDGERTEFSVDLFRGSDDFMHAVLLEERGERNDAKGIRVTTISFFRVGS